MKLISFIILFLISLICDAQSLKHKTLNCDVLIDPFYGGNVNIYNSQGKIIKKIRNNLKEEEYIILTIIGKNDSMFNVIANQGNEGEVAKGWIKKNNPKIGVYSRAYASALNLYQKPEKKSNIQSVIKEYTPALFCVKDGENNWLYISIVIAHKRYEGWMSPDMQCANPVTTCN